MRVRKSLAMLVTGILLACLLVGLLPRQEGYAESTTMIIIYYNRPGADYEKWNLWIWEYGREGEVFHFTEEDEFGVYAMIELQGDINKVGFIVRTDAWEKDVDVDRFIEIKDGFAEIWVNSGQEKFSHEPPEGLTMRQAHKHIHLTIHYDRYDNDYEGWNLWLWKEDQEGTSFNFTDEDEYGKIANITLEDMSEIEKIGFIVRRSLDGNDWAAKDIEESRFIRVIRADAEDNIEIFLRQGVRRISYNVDDVDRSPRIVSATLSGPTKIIMEVNIPYKWQGDICNNLSLKLEGEEVEIVEIMPLDKTEDNFVRKVSVVMPPLELTRALTKNYTISKKGYGQIDVSTVGCAIFASEEFYNEFHYDGDDLGAIYAKERTPFRVWLPAAAAASLMLYEEGSGGEAVEIIMHRDVQGTWKVTVEGDLKGKFYTYKVVVDGSEREATDPYAKAVGINGRRGMVVDLSETNPDGWENLQRPPLEKFTDVIIYELHVRDLSMHENSGIINKGKFLGVIEEGTKSPDGKKTGLDHMKELGITHLHLLPVFDFRSIDETRLEGNAFNWGYDPQNYNVPEGSFSIDPFCGITRIKEFKKMVQGLNENGIRVIMDVVYNHTGYTANSHLNLLVPGYYYRFNPDGSFSNGSGCGNELADERSMVRKMIVDSVIFWATEYKIDGFRFDLMGLHDIETMNEIRKALDKIDPTILIYGEGWTAGATPLPSYRQALKVNIPKMPGIAAFSDDIRDGIKGHVFNAEAPGFVNGGLGFEESVKFGIVASTRHDQIDYAAVNYSNAPWAKKPAQAINYVSSHDNHTLWDKLAITNPNDSIEERIKMHKLSNAIVLTSQGIPFLHAGVEVLRTKGGDHNSYQSPDSVNMLDWSRKTTYNEVFQYHKGLIELRKQRPAFRMTSTEDIQRHLRFLDMPQKNMVGYILNDNANDDEWETIAVLFNANEENIEVTLPAKGWGVVVNSEVAGTEIVENIRSDKVIVPSRTAMVLVQQSDIKDDLPISVYLSGAVVIIVGLYYFFKKRSKK